MSLGAGLLAFGLIFLLFLGVALLVEVFFLLNLQETLRRVSSENRRVTPGYVWLTLIPGFGMFWFIYLVVKITDSLRDEYRSSGWQSSGDFGYGVGLAAGILNIAGLVWQWVPHRVTAVGGLLTIGYVVCWIIYWVRTARMKNRLGPATQWGVAPGGPYSSQGQSWSPPYAGTPDARTSTEDQPAPAGDAGHDEYGSACPDGLQRRCAACGTAVAPDDRYCRGCGTTLT